ncbi:MAG: hypothetical protein V3U85_00785, partial [Hyphomicrobium sp.]
FAAVFLAAGFFAADFLAAGFFAADFLVAGFFAAVFLAAGFFAAVFLATDFLATVFFAAVLLATGFLAVDFLATVLFGALAFFFASDLVAILRFSMTVANKTPASSGSNETGNNGIEIWSTNDAPDRIRSWPTINLDLSVTYFGQITQRV